MSSKLKFGQAGKALPDAVMTVLQTLEEHGHEAFLVGGCVRDMMLGRPLHDYDVATSALPGEVMGLFEAVVPTGVEHGTVTVIISRLPVEVTTYRIDTSYSDGRHPDAVVYAKNLEADLMRRDFTINAMAMNKELQLVDLLGGHADLEGRTIRAVGDPHVRFSEDALRILRAVRFSAQLGFVIAEETHNAMIRESDRLQLISMERVGQELKRIAETNWISVISMLADEPYLARTQKPLAALQRSFSRLCSRFLENDGMTFERWRQFVGEGDDVAIEPGLAAVSLWMTELADVHDPMQTFRPLAWSKAFLKQARLAATWLLAEPWKWPELRWREALFEGDEGALGITAVLADFLDFPQAHPSCRELFKHVKRSTPITHSRQLALTGKDLIEMGFSGPAIGEAVKRMVKAVLMDEVDNQREALRRFLLFDERSTE